MIADDVFTAAMEIVVGTHDGAPQGWTWSCVCGASGTRPVHYDYAARHGSVHESVCKAPLIRGVKVILIQVSR